MTYRAVERMADIILEHACTLSPAGAKAMLRDIHTLAVKPSRSGSRGGMLDKFVKIMHAERKRRFQRHRGASRKLNQH
jgi:hypothetical protein